MGKSLEPRSDRDQKKSKWRKKESSTPFFISSEQQLIRLLRDLYPDWKLVITTQKDSGDVSAGVEVDGRSLTPKVSMHRDKLKQTITIEPVTPPAPLDDQIDITPDGQDNEDPDISVPSETL